MTLGPTPPTLGGVKVHGSNSEEAMIEIEFSWVGRCSLTPGVHS